MNVKELLMKDQGIEVKISSGTGVRDDPYVVENCSALEAAITQMQLLKGINRGQDELWHIIEWKPCNIGSSTEVIRYDSIRFSETQVETTRFGLYFDTRAVAGDPYSLHPLISWHGPAGTPNLPFELGWLHYDETINNSRSVESLDQTVLYSCLGAKASVYVYDRSETNLKEACHTEFDRVLDIVKEMHPTLEEPWPVLDMGPFVAKFCILGNDITVVGVAVCGSYFIKVRLTFFDDLKMRELMNESLLALITNVQQVVTEQH